MAFSFTPGQIAPQGSQASTAPGTPVPGAVLAPVSGPPSTSPFLFIKERGQPLSIMACVQIVLIVAAVLSITICAVMYSYSIYLKSQIDSKKAELLGKEDTMQAYNYEKMKKLSDRMALLDKLLKNYVSSLSPLKLLENIVEDQVTFNKFTLGRNDLGTIVVNFSVEGKNYRALVQQLEALKLPAYKKVATDPQSSGLIDSPTLVLIKVSTPVAVQGKLSKEIGFFDEVSNTATTTPTKVPSNTGNVTP